jgi:hypothetical protein
LSAGNPELRPISINRHATRKIKSNRSQNSSKPITRTLNQNSILWLDHEEIIPLGEKAVDRKNLNRLEHPLYDYLDEFLKDVFN